ncbi:MAG TPA: DUF2169 domain-containing protein [Gemmobacter sp.]|nr:DUF2169 domain-containing protein [Gemmobacter sp.]
MWEIENRSPFPHRGGFLRDEAARTFWCLHLKASFALRPQPQGQPGGQGFGLQFLPEQPALLQGPLMEGDRLLAEAEVGHARPLCDLILTGSVTPPEGGTLLEARLPGWRKAVQVLPARHWHEGRSRPATNAPVPLDWRAGFGGPDCAENPLGLGHRPSEGASLPRLAPEGTAPDATSFAPVSFAPIPRDWPARAQWAGTYDTAWSRRRAPLLPADLDPRYWQSAPPDQWLDPAHLPGATLHLSGFAPQPMAIPIPDCELEFATRFRGQWHQQTPRLQSLTVDLSAGTLSLLWLATLPIQAAQNDVLVERSFIALHKGRGFTVSAADMPVFSTPWEAA